MICCPCSAAVVYSMGVHCGIISACSFCASKVACAPPHRSLVGGNARAFFFSPVCRWFKGRETLARVKSEEMHRQDDDEQNQTHYINI